MADQSNKSVSLPQSTGEVEGSPKRWWLYPPNSKKLGRAQQVFVACSLLLWFVPCLAVTIYAFAPGSEFFQTWCVGLAAMSAAFLSGTLLGFLFALPRSMRIEVPSGAETRVYVRPNNNLEDVSDWLTKIVVGLTLIQLESIPGLAVSLFNWVGAGLGGDQSDVVFAGSVIVYSLAAGLMQAWIATRLFIIEWMDASDAKRRRAMKRSRQNSEFPTNQGWSQIEKRPVSNEAGDVTERGTMPGTGAL